MSAERLEKIPEADIDPNGVFKYVLIRVHSKTDESYVDIVRGYAWAEYHGTELRAEQPSFLNTKLAVYTKTNFSLI